MKQLPYGRQSISDEDIEAVVAVLKSDFLTQGPVVPMFEQTVSNYVHSRFATATNSATSALHLACLALGVGPGDIVWTSAITFVASANCAYYCGATCDFVDIDPQTYNISMEALDHKLKFAAINGTLPKVLIAVHLAGQSCDMEEIGRLSQRYGFKVIEDASHAIGGLFNEEPIGNCKFSDITVFSFHPVKIITSGEGGMAVTNDPSLHRKMALLRSHGVTRNPNEMIGPALGPWYYEQIELGFNYRLTDIQAALGLSQLARLDEFVDRRHQIARKYDDLLAGTRMNSPLRVPTGKSAFHLYIIRVEEDANGPDRRQLFERLRENGIQANLHYMPVYRQPFHAQSAGDRTNEFPNAEAYFRTAISLPIFPAMLDDDINKVVDLLTQPLGYQTFF